jgi:hypothetical protein
MLVAVALSGLCLSEGESESEKTYSSRPADAGFIALPLGEVVEEIPGCIPFWVLFTGEVGFDLRPQRPIVWCEDIETEV